MLAAIDIHKAVFQAAVLDPADGEITEERFNSSREALGAWLVKWDGRLEASGRLKRTGAALREAVEAAPLSSAATACRASR